MALALLPAPVVISRVRCATLRPMTLQCRLDRCSGAMLLHWRRDSFAFTKRQSCTVVSRRTGLIRGRPPLEPGHVIAAGPRTSFLFLAGRAAATTPMVHVLAAAEAVPTYSDDPSGPSAGAQAGAQAAQRRPRPAKTDTGRFVRARPAPRLPVVLRGWCQWGRTASTCLRPHTRASGGDSSLSFPSHHSTSAPITPPTI